MLMETVRLITKQTKVHLPSTSLDQLRELLNEQNENQWNWAENIKYWSRGDE